MSLVSLLGSVANSFLGNKLSEHFQKKAEQRQFEYTRQLNAEMNAYNTPHAQMQRYIEAGMNPYMASVSSGTQGSSGSVSTASGYTEKMGDAIDRAFAIRNANADLRMKELALEKQGIENEYLPAQIKATLDNMVANSNLAKYNALTVEHDYNIIKNQKNTSSKETGFWPSLDRLFGKSQSNLNNTYNQSVR